MTTTGYIVIGILMILTIIAIILCEVNSDEELKNVSEGILMFLIILMLATIPV